MPEIKSNRAWRLECEALRQQSTELKAEIQTIRNSPTMDTIRQVIQSKLAAENDQLREQLGTTEDHLRRVEQAFESTNAKLRDQVTLLRDVMSRIAFTRTGKCIDLAQELFDREDWATEALAATEQKP